MGKYFMRTEYAGRKGALLFGDNQDWDDVYTVLCLYSAQ